MNIGTLFGNPTRAGFSVSLRTRIGLFVATVLCLPAVTLADDSINTVSPSWFYVFSTEEYVTITGSGLAGTASTKVQYSGDAGTFTLEATLASSSSVFVWVPGGVLRNVGPYSLTVLATDCLESHRDEDDIEICDSQTEPRVTGQGTLTVIERPNTDPPLIAVPEAYIVAATSPAGAVVTFNITGQSSGGGVLPASCTPPSGSLFPLGTTIVQCSVSDANGTTTGRFPLIVDKSTPPVVDSIAASPATIWPPNHKMVAVTVTVQAHNVVVPGTPVSRIISVWSNQPINGPGDGNTDPDWQITGPLTVDLRAERAGNDDRRYSILVATATSLPSNDPDVEASDNITYTVVNVMVSN